MVKKIELFPLSALAYIAIHFVVWAGRGFKVVGN